MRAPPVQLPHPAVHLPGLAVFTPPSPGHLAAGSTFQEALGPRRAGHGAHLPLPPFAPAPPAERERRRVAQDHNHEATDPLTRQTAQLAPPLLPGAPLPSAAPSAGAGVCARVSLEDLLPALVRKVAWSGDGRRGAVRLELGSGPLAGATLLIQTDQGRVRVDLRAPDGADLGDWRARIARRLAARGLDVEHVEVT